MANPTPTSADQLAASLFVLPSPRAAHAVHVYAEWEEGVWSEDEDWEDGEWGWGDDGVGGAGGGAAGGGVVSGGGGGGGGSGGGAAAAAAAAPSSNTAAAMVDASAAAVSAPAAVARDVQLDAFRDRVHLGSLEAVLQTGVTRHTGRDDRATSEQVLDPRTRMILFKLLAQGFISRVCGCVSTGKEANVYYAERPGGAGPLALKIYKTSILVFKDRDRYVSGEFRFRSGYARGNPRKMVKLWAEKEMRNLKRLHAAGLPVPRPHLLRMHVLAMDFFGDDGWPAPRLKDAAATLPSARLSAAYVELADLMRAMYQRCGLVHGDLSEYNLLWHEGSLAVIDVGQSVESDHPGSLEFLRVDCANVSDFFRRAGVLVMAPRDLFDYVVHASLSSRSAEQAYLDAAMARAEARGDAGAEGEANAAVEDAVFMGAYIPQSLHGVRNIEKDASTAAAGGADALLYGALTGLVGAPGGGGGGGEPAAAAAATGVESESEEQGNSGSGSEDSDSGEEGGGEEGTAREAQYVRRGSTKEEQKAHRAAVKEAAREKRKNKLPKHLKKKATKK
jgi:RIO kinase 1